MITNDDYTPLFDALEDIGFTIDTTNNRAYWKTSGIYFFIYSGFVRISNTSNNYMADVSSYRLTQNITKLYYIKFNENSIALGFNISGSSSTGYFTAYIVEPDVGETVWAAITVNNYFYTSSNAATNLPAYISNTRGAIMPDSFLIVPAKLRRSDQPFNLKNIYLFVYGPIKYQSLEVGHIENKQYLVAYNGTQNSGCPPFAIDVDVIWDDEDY